MLNIDIIPCLQDNYSFVVHDAETDTVAVIDPSEFKPINDFIEKKFKKINYIFNTHHHFDHTGGNLDLQKKYKAKIIGSDVIEDTISLLSTLGPESPKKRSAPKITS